MPSTRKQRREVIRVPRGETALPEFDRGAVPEGLVTRRTLREMGLSPGGNRGPVAILIPVYGRPDATDRISGLFEQQDRHAFPHPGL
ncbi:hypothetical protein AB0N96_33035, partial [Streptomyces cyaneofuscatus]